MTNPKWDTPLYRCWRVALYFEKTGGSWASTARRAAERIGPCPTDIVDSFTEGYGFKRAESAPEDSGETSDERKARIMRALKDHAAGVHEEIAKDGEDEINIPWR